MVEATQSGESSTVVSSRVVELLDLARRAPDDEETEDEIAGRIGELESEELRQLADGLAGEEDSGLVQLRSGVLWELGEDDEAAAAAAGLVVQGVDLLGMFYGWMHAADPLLATRRYVAISRALLGRYEVLDEAGRRYADLFLCQEGFGAALESCSLEEVRQRLARLEEGL